MHDDQPKKLLILKILDVLKRFSDADHRLSQKDISALLQSEYGLAVDRKSIKRNVTALLEMGYNINFRETLRMIPGKNGKMEESYILSDFYLEREFSDSELRLLIDSLLFCKHLPYGQCKELVRKLEGLSSQHFRSRVRHIHTLPDNVPQNRQLFYTIEVLDEAITREKQVTFTYNKFGTDKKLHPNRREDGTVRQYVINPYQIVATNGRYYLICNHDKYDDVAHYRLDRITDIRLLDTPVKPMRRVKELENGLNLPRHMAEHLYMFSGKSIPVTFRLKKQAISDCLDWFGKDTVFSDETQEEVTARVTVNARSMQMWAMQYVNSVRILSPAWLVEEVSQALRKGLQQYEEK